MCFLFTCFLVIFFGRVLGFLVACFLVLFFGRVVRAAPTVGRTPGAPRRLLVDIFGWSALHFPDVGVLGEHRFVPKLVMKFMNMTHVSNHSTAKCKVS